MTIKLTPGEIYFIREKDILTNEKTSYVKVGLVKEKVDRDSENRLAEHQTGNPRELSVFKVIETPAVSEIEKMLHGIFATNRVNGEWFNFTDDQLSQCIEEAEALVKEAESNLEFFSEQDKLSKVLSSGEVKQPTDEIAKFHHEYLCADIEKKSCNPIIKKVKEILGEAVDQGEEGADELATVRESERKTFSKEDFQNSYPDLWEKYLTREEKISGSFRWTQPKDFQEDLSVINPELDTLIKEISEIITVAEERQGSIETLHQLRVQLIGYETRANWRMKIAKANVAVFCGRSPEVEGICKWTRESKMYETFEKNKFKEENPAIYKEFTSTTIGSRTRVRRSGRN